jgi:hypothetical protein
MAIKYTNRLHTLQAAKNLPKMGFLVLKIYPLATQLPVDTFFQSDETNEKEWLSQLNEIGF